MKTYKNHKELKEGSCIVVTKNQIDGRIKEFEGSYNSRLGVVFFTIPYLYKIIEYRQ